MRGLGLFLVFSAMVACTEAPPVIEATTRLEATPDTVGPYTVQSVIVGVTDHQVELRYRVDDDWRFIPLPMTAEPDGELFRAAIPGQPAGATISYFVTVLADGERVVDDPEGAGAAPYVFAILQ